MWRRRLLTLNDYQTEALKTRLPSANTTYLTLGLVGEVGELYGKWAKVIRDGGQLDRPDVVAELGDILWMLTALCKDLGTTLEEVAQYNIKKLHSRAQRNTLQGSGDTR
jgi:NTP pyrophosphatase (non-canonical NTP hydrolase)